MERKDTRKQEGDGEEGREHGCASQSQHSHQQSPTQRLTRGCEPFPNAGRWELGELRPGTRPWASRGDAFISPCVQEEDF